MIHTARMFVANWKMNMPYAAALAFCKQHKEELDHLCKKAAADIVIAPSYVLLAPLAELFKKTDLKISAQNCAPFQSGAYTGEVDAQSLKEVGCSYCIVGHSERRRLFGETDTDIANKVARLLEQGIQPIICIGETEEQYKHKQTNDILEQQLQPIIDSIDTTKKHMPLVIAYEPVWAIGTGAVPATSYLEETFKFLAQKTALNLPSHPIQFLYGGSINENNATEIMAIPGIDGLLIGNASLDFQKFKNIVLLNR